MGASFQLARSSCGSCVLKPASPAAACSSLADSATGCSWTNRASLVSRRIHQLLRVPPTGSSASGIFIPASPGPEGRVRTSRRMSAKKKSHDAMFFVNTPRRLPRLCSRRIHRPGMPRVAGQPGSTATASASVGQRAGSTECLVVPAKSPDLVNAVAQCFLPGPVVHLLPVSCRNPCRPNSNEQVVGHSHAFRG